MDMRGGGTNGLLRAIVLVALLQLSYCLPLIDSDTTVEVNLKGHEDPVRREVPLGTTTRRPLFGVNSDRIPLESRSTSITALAEAQ